jgi:hypothetical protein
MKVKRIKNMLFGPVPVVKKNESLSVGGRKEFFYREDEETAEIRALIEKGSLKVVECVEDNEDKREAVKKTFIEEKIEEKIIECVEDDDGVKCEVVEESFVKEEIFEEEVIVKEENVVSVNVEKRDDPLTKQTKRKKNKKRPLKVLVERTEE